MEALVYFSKYLGVYHMWKQIKERHALKWYVQNDVAIFQTMTNDVINYDAMVKWVSSARSKLPSEYADALLFGVLTGLRASEVCHSINLISTDFSNYYDESRGLLTHYKYPVTFIRNTKKAYVSIATAEMMDIVRRISKTISYEMIRKGLDKVGLPMHMSYTRKIFGTFLKKEGVYDEIIDLLQGRLPRSVFLRFYNRPNFQEEVERLREIIRKLHSEVGQLSPISAN